MILHRILAISVIITLFLMITGTVALIFYVRGTNVTVLCSAKSSIIFQNEINKTVQLNIDSSLLNLSDGKIRIYNGGGSFRFTALNDTQITITHNISITDNIIKGAGDHSMYIQEGEHYVIDGNTIRVS